MDFFIGFGWYCLYYYKFRIKYSIRNRMMIILEVMYFVGWIFDYLINFMKKIINLVLVN